MEHAAALIQTILEDAGVPQTRVSCVGLAVGGLIEAETGRCILSTNQNWKEVNLRELAEARFDIPVTVSNVTDAAALAEARLLAQDDCDNFVWIYAGTGIGAAIVSQGQIFRGRSGFSGEIGFCRGQPGGPTIEELASGRAIVAAVESRRSESPLFASSGSEIKINAILKAAEDGDVLARSVVERAGRDLGLAVSYLVHIINPERAILGGGVAEKSDIFLAAVRETVNSEVLGPEAVELSRTALVGEVVTIGAIQLAMEHSVQSFRIVAR